MHGLFRIIGKTRAFIAWQCQSVVKMHAKLVKCMQMYALECLGRASPACPTPQPADRLSFSFSFRARRACGRGEPVRACETCLPNAGL